METCDVIVCDVDGVINIFADDGFIWSDIQSKRLFIDGKSTPLFTFSPTVARELGSIKQAAPFLWLTSWNDKTQFLTQLGFPEAEVLHVEKGRETESKIAHVAKLAQNQKVLWIDDFAEEWRGMLPQKMLTNVVSLQTDHRQGLTPSDIATVKKWCGIAF